MIGRRDSLTDVLTAVGADMEAARWAFPDTTTGRWALDVFLSVVGWAAGLLFMGFVVTILPDDLEVSRWVGALVGGVLLGAAWLLDRRPPPHQGFLLQLVLAGYLASAGLLTWALVEGASWSGCALGASAVGGLLAVATRDPRVRFLALLWAVGMGATYWGLEDGMATLHRWAVPTAAIGGGMLLAEERWGRWPGRLGPLGPIANALLLSAMCLTVPPLVGAAEAAWSVGLTTGLGAALCLGALWSASTARDTPERVALSAAVVVLAILLWRTPGVLYALLTMALAFHRRRPALLAVATLFFAGFLAWFYYDLSLTLWVKAGMLVGSGAVLLAVRGWLWAPEEATCDRV